LGDRRRHCRHHRVGTCRKLDEQTVTKGIALQCRRQDRESLRY
jgi:hypothetical protein